MASSIAHGWMHMHDGGGGGVAQDDGHTAPNKLTES